MRPLRLTLLLFSSLFLLVAISTIYADSLRVPTDTPDPVMTGAEATNFVIQAPKIYYLNDPLCAPIHSPDSPDTPTGLLTQTVGRTAVSGSPPRAMYDFTYDLFCEPPDTPDIISDIVADDDYIYWISQEQGGLVRISEDLMIWDSTPPELIYPHPPRTAELVMVGDYIYMIQTGFNSTGLWRIHKTTGAATQLLNGSQVGSVPYNFQTDGQYLYWQFAQATTRSLERYRLSNNAHNTIDTEVYGYFPVAGNTVYIGYEDVIRSYDHTSGDLSAPIYTSTGPAYITSLSADGSALYFIQQPTVGSGTTLYRLPFFGTAVPLHVSSSYMTRLQINGSYLFFLEGTSLMRIRTNADPALLTNMYIDGLEITQAIQSDSNSVPLVQGKRTAVRLFVRSAGAAIPGVMAHLYRVDGSGTVIAGPLTPINLDRVSHFLRVQSSPNRDNLSDSFIFFLPPDWIDDPTLRLRAELNPYRFPPEPGYADNTLITATFNLDVSRRLETHFVLFEYESGGSRYRPRYELDFLQTVSWVRRAFPLASTPGWYTNPSPGFRPAYRYLYNADLGGNVDGTGRHPDCQRRIELPPGSDGYLDDPSLCAAWYVVCPALDAIRAAESLPDSIFQVGMVADDRGFPRGWACGRGVSTPSGSGDWGWDTDGSYADWYGGHEIGHSQGRGHTFGDPSYPYPDQEIGTSAYRGFDFGDTGLNGLLIPRVYPNEWHDVMSYSNNQWISDYTYVGIKNFSGLVAAPEQAVGGDYLQLSGVLFPDEHTADITQARRWTSLGFTPTPPTPGAYRIRLLDSGGELVHYDFTPVVGEDDSVLLVSEFVPFVLGTTRLEITHPGSGDLVWSYDLSANAPVVGNVQLVSPPSPVSGEVTLDWDASDADGDLLTYDVLYSDDDGVSWQVISMGLTASAAEIDTAELAGSLQGRFKVIANDGLNQGEAFSTAYNVQMKAPTITVISPADGQTFVYGEEVYFAAEVYDLQDGDVTDIEWRDQTNFLLGTGTEFSQDDLIIGANEITVTAVNSEGLSSSVTFTIYVDDEWQPPAPALTVGPDQVSFWVAEGTTALQTTTVAVNNVGEGEFTVTVAENVPWLSVSPAGGSTPLQLTLTADPAYLEPGQVLSAELVITGDAGSGTQAVVVPVSFGMGAITQPGGGGMIYLPVIVKP